MADGRSSDRGPSRSLTGLIAEFGVPDESVLTVDVA